MSKKLKCVSLLLALSILFSFPASANETLSVSDYVNTPDWATAQTIAPNNAADLNLGGKSIILIEETTGKVLYEREADLKLPPASITKIMTLLLTMEALENGKFTLDTQVACSEHAASMGGAQIWLKEGEKMSVDDILKAVCIKSANDASVVLAELVGGSEDGFVNMMNARAKELGMTNTTFKNASGLDAEGHLTTARDIATMSRALMRHDKIFEYTRIWMDTLRGGQTELVNTNKLIRFYKGATGLKTGTTAGAGSCLSATAERDGLSLIGVVMGYPNSKERNAAARKLLDYGFANFEIVTPETPTEIPEALSVKGGMKESVLIGTEGAPKILKGKNQSGKIETKLNLVEGLTAPVQKGQTVGSVDIYLGGKKHSSYDIKTTENIDEMSFFRAFLVILKNVF